MITLLSLSLLTASADEQTARTPRTAQQVTQATWQEAAAAGDADKLKAICAAAGGELQLKNGGGMAQPGMDMASMMMANMMMQDQQQQASCTSGRETLAWDATDWDKARVEEPKRR